MKSRKMIPSRIRIYLFSQLIIIKIMVTSNSIPSYGVNSPNPFNNSEKGNKELKFKVVQRPYLDLPSNLSWAEQEKRRNEMFLGCCCYGCGGDECGDGK